MIASSFAYQAAKTPDSFPANFPTPPKQQQSGQPPQSIPLSIFEVWQSMLTSTFAIAGACALTDYFDASTPQKILNFDVDAFKSYFDPIPRALNQLSTPGFACLVEPRYGQDNGVKKQLTDGVYIDVTDDQSFTLYLSNATGEGVAAQFKHNQDILKFYTLTEINKTEAFHDSGQPLGYKTVQELQTHFQDMIKQIDDILKPADAPDPGPPGTSLEFAA